MPAAPKRLGFTGQRLRIRIAAPPQRDRANRELCAYLAERCGVRSAEVVAARTARAKQVLVRGVDAAAARRALSANRE